MHHYVQSLSFKKIVGLLILFSAIVFLFVYSDGSLDNYYYTTGILELSNFSNKDQIKLKELWNNELHQTTTVSQNTKIIPNGKEYIRSEIETTDITSDPIFNFKSTLRSDDDRNDYLVWSPECKIPNFDPFNKDAMVYFHKEKYLPCNKQKLLSYIKINDNNEVTLYINRTVLPSYTKNVNNIQCCCSYASRHGSKKKPDEGITFSLCVPFKNSFKVTQDIVRVTCRTSKKKFYKNVHQIIKVKDEFAKKKKTKATTPSVLFIGIDSISRLNFIRAFNETYKFLSENNETWLPLNGYNKIGDNTFPNLMAIFTGYNSTEAYKICNPKVIGPLDSCRFIWKDYKKFGYITAYAEDETSINTFNYRKKGFKKEPVDYYFKPYMEACESLGTYKQDTLSYCSGPESSGERIMNLAKNFAITYKNYATFGFFWMNTFSHNNLNTASRMDDKILNLLKDISREGVLDESIVIFLSDHGIRFGDIRHTFTGWLEERLPFIYFSFPNWFKQKFPNEITNFRKNSNRLTTPYDLHLTLQHILILAGYNYTMKNIDTCPLCRSLLTEIPLNRSCENTGITPDWCTCRGYTELDKKDEFVTKAAYFLIRSIQEIIVKKGGHLKCAKYSLGKVLFSYKSDRFNIDNKDTYYLLIAIETHPKAVFESTINFKKVKNSDEAEFSIDNSISRLDSYATHGKCVSDEYLKKYCFCN